MQLLARHAKRQLYFTVVARPGVRHLSSSEVPAYLESRGRMGENMGPEERERV